VGKAPPAGQRQQDGGDDERQPEMLHVPLQFLYTHCLNDHTAHINPFPALAGASIATA
jgi:hypothetical protein